MYKQYTEHIDKEDINKLEVSAFEGEIVVVDSFKKVQEAVNYLNSFDEIGFDTESRPSFKKGKVNEVALLQLATREKAFLFRLNKIGLPAEVVGLLEDLAIKKVGLALHDDVKILQKLNKFRAKSFLDLQKYVPAFGIKDQGLQKIAAIVLGVKISKSQRMSNWERPTLAPEQALYAATDAWVSLEIYLRLQGR